MNTTEANVHLPFGLRQSADFLEFLSQYNQDKLDWYKESDRILNLAVDISNIYIWILFAIGVPSNILTIITILTLQSVNPAIFFIALLAALDGTSLIAKLTGHQLIRKRISIGMAGCKFEFLVPYVTTLANWLLIFICAERFISVCFPAKKRRILTMKNCYLAVSIVALTLLVLFASIGMSMRGSASKGWRCGTYNEYRWFWANIWFWINATVYLFIPIACILPMTIMIVRKLYISSRKGNIPEEKETASEQEPPINKTLDATESEVEANEGGLTLMISIASLLFVLLCLPACIFYLSYRSTYDPRVDAKWILFEQVQFLLADSTHVINFFVYFFSVRRFRSQVWKLVTCKLCRRNSQSCDLTTA